jgi:hypothetical protein
MRLHTRQAVRLALPDREASAGAGVAEEGSGGSTGTAAEAGTRGWATAEAGKL